jgi:hypothetical protein
MDANVNFNLSNNSSLHKFQITGGMLCAGGELDKDSCQVEQSVQHRLCITFLHTRATVAALSQSLLAGSIHSLAVSALEKGAER